MITKCPICGKPGEGLFSRVDCGTPGCKNYVSRLDITPVIGSRVKFITDNEGADWSDEEFFLLTTDCDFDGRLTFTPGYEDNCDTTVIHIESGYLAINAFPFLYCPVSATQKIV